MLAGVVAALLAACGSSSSGAGGRASGSGASGGSGGSSSKVLIGYENNGADPSMVSLGMGDFKKELGSGASTQLFDSGPVALGALASGSLQFMCGIGLPPVLSALAKGVPLAVVWNQERYTNDAGIVVKANSGITSLAGLKGKTVAIVTGSEASFELPTLLHNAGVPLSSVHQLNMSPPAMRSAWLTGQISAAIVWDPVFDYLSSHGGRVLATDAGLPPTATSYNICVANKNYLSSHRQAAAEFAKAMQDGVAYWKSDPSAALAVMEKEAGIDAATAKTELAGYQIYDLSDQTTSQVLGATAAAGSSSTAESLLNNWKELYSQGFLTSKPPTSAAQYVDSAGDEAAVSGSGS